MNIIVVEYLSWFFIGIILGTIHYWSKKLMWFLWISAIIISVFTRFESYDYSVKGISNWHYFGLVPVLWAGAWFGESMCKQIWGERE